LRVAERIQLQSELGILSTEELSLFFKRYAWLAAARPDQLPPPSGTFFTWLMLAGRGAGKTRAGAEHVSWAGRTARERIAICAPTSGDVRKTCYEGESGLLSVLEDSTQGGLPGCIMKYSRASMELWLTNGTYYIGYSSEEPERLRGPQHHRAWCDELAAWKYPDDMWDMLLFGLRLGHDPEVVATTTPKPIKLVRDLVSSQDTVVAKASTFDNADNLPPKIIEKLRNKFDGTRLGRQELYAEILDDNPYALWNLTMLDKNRRHMDVLKGDTLVNVAVAVDPPVSTGEDADECGITVCGVGESGHGYVLEDLSEQGLSPEGWADVAVYAYRRHSANMIVAEVNQGGDLVQSVIKTADPKVPVKKVRASRGKVTRAEPVAALYEQGRVHHVGRLPTLEDQMCDFTTDFDKKRMGYSPDRVDSLVWNLTHLMLTGEAGEPRIRSL